MVGKALKFKGYLDFFLFWEMFLPAALAIPITLHPLCLLPIVSPSGKLWIKVGNFGCLRWK